MINSPKIIELGGGANPRYHPNLDAIEGDMICDLTEGIPFSDSSIGKVFSQDFFEHLTFVEGLELLRECNRVLRKGGVLEFIIPDVGAAIQPNIEWNDHIRNIVFGTRWHKFDIHKCWYSPDLMTFILQKLGWGEVAIELLPSEEPKFIVRAKK